MPESDRTEDTPVPASPLDTPSQGTQGQEDGAPSTAPPVGLAATTTTTPTTGRRLAFSNLGRQLGVEDLASPGVQKLLLELLDRADADCEELSIYRDRFHIADKEVARLEEHVKTHTALGVAYGVGVGFGCGLIGIAPNLWDVHPYGHLVLAFGVLLVAGGIVVRVIKR